MAQTLQGKYRAILLFGMPGSGKGTQGGVLGQLPGLIHISSGEVFRKLPRYGELGQEIIRYTSQGLLVPDDVVVRVFARHMKALELQDLLLVDHHVVLLDGLPRSYVQAQRLDEFLKVIQIFHLVINDIGAATDRLRIRALRENRLDDISEEVIKKRFDVYYKETYQTLKYYDPKLVTEIEASTTPLHVLHQVVNRLVELEQVEGDFSLFDPNASDQSKATAASSPTTGQDVVSTTQ